MQSVTTVLTNEDTEEEKTEEDKMREEIKKSGKQPNVSMIAFTATPKPDTIQLFGTLNAEGKKESFDLYSMKQAIEEGYILNVLDNYVTWKTYCHINKAIEDDPELKTIAAKRKMARFIDLHTTNIAQKVEIIVEHFRANVAHLLGGSAKAMVVTSSIQAAVEYKQAFVKYIHDHGYTDIKALVAFSGKVKIKGVEYSEYGMNQIKEEELRYEFDRSCYQVLIVANKYQTGFDQPKLVAMYVDKKLKGFTSRNVHLIFLTSWYAAERASEMFSICSVPIRSIRNCRPTTPIRRTWTSITKLSKELWTMQTQNFRYSLSEIVWLTKPPHSGCANTWMRLIGTQAFSKAGHSWLQWTIPVFIRTISLRCRPTRLWRLDWN